MTTLEALTATTINPSPSGGVSSGTNTVAGRSGGVQFSTIFESTKAPANSNSADADRSAESIRSEEVAKSFEAMLISQFVGEIFAEQKGSFFGEGFQGDFYSSLFSDAIAKQLSERGGFGFAKML